MNQSILFHKFLGYSSPVGAQTPTKHQLSTETGMLPSLFSVQPSQVAAKEVASFASSTSIDEALIEADRKLSEGISLLEQHVRPHLVVTSGG